MQVAEKAEIEPIDYRKINNNPPLWVVQERQNTPISSRKNELEAETESAALYAMSGLIILSGFALFTAGLILPISLFWITTICGVGLAIASSGMLSFASIYRNEIIGHGQEKL